MIISRSIILDVYIGIRVQKFTSNKVNLRQYINGGSVYSRCLHEKFWKSRFVFGMVFELILANEAIPSSKCFIIAPTE